MQIEVEELKDSKKVEDEHLRIFASFSHLNSGMMDRMISRWHPPTDVFHTDEKMIIISEIAGICEKRIRITSEGNLLRIEGERDEITSEERATFLNMEINYGPFERNIHLPREFIGGKVSARYSNGFLRIEVIRVPSSTIRVEVE